MVLKGERFRRRRNLETLACRTGARVLHNCTRAGKLIRAQSAGGACCQSELKGASLASQPPVLIKFRLASHRLAGPRRGDVSTRCHEIPERDFEKLERPADRWTVNPYTVAAPVSRVRGSDRRSTALPPRRRTADIPRVDSQFPSRSGTFDRISGSNRRGGSGRTCYRASALDRSGLED